MSVIIFDHVWKKFKRGEKLNSLRDFVPSLFRNAISGNNGLNKEEFWALQDVSFSIKKGEVVGIIGANGAGKSTSLKLLAGIIKPNKGAAEVNGRLSALIEVTAGFHPDLTGRENVYLNGTILGMRKKEIDAKFDEIVEFSGVGEFIDTPVKRYSSGMYSRLGFSVAAHMNPDVLLVDEVLSVGDIAFQAKCAQKMRELLKSNTTIVIVSHNLSLIQSLCKRVIFLDKGRICKEGPVDEVIPYYQNIVYRNQQEEFKKKISADEFKVKVSQDNALTISGVSFFGADDAKKENFNIGETLAVRIEYMAKIKIESPVFFVEIIRADGIVCCSSSTQDNGFALNVIEGSGSIKVDFGRTNLASGLYTAKVSIFDKSLIHPYVISRNNVFEIEAATVNGQSRSVIFSSAKWSSI